MSSKSTQNKLQVVPLGGLAEFGKNMMVYRHGEDAVIVDAGMMFPGDGLPGVDFLVPDLEYLHRCPHIHGLILTHGHEDHIGGVPHLLQAHPEMAIYATAHVEEILRVRLAEYREIRNTTIRRLPEEGSRLELGPFGLETIAVAHSIPCARSIVLHTPVGTILHTADFKFDDDPIDGVHTDIDRFRDLGSAGVLALLIDSTNADRAGSTPGEHVAAAGLLDVIAGAEERVFVTLFSSNIHRLQSLYKIANETGRRVAVVGASLIRHLDIAERLGLLHVPSEIRIAPKHAMGLPRNQLLVAVTGSQGEPSSALSRIAFERHRDFFIEAGDLVIHSARRIPGNEKRIERVFNELVRIGVHIVTPDDAPVHVSGHPAREDIRRILDAVRPQYVIPVHGEHRQLFANRALAIDWGLEDRDVPLVTCGERLLLDSEGWELRQDVPVGEIFIDGLRERVPYDVVRERRQVAHDGLVVVAYAVDAEERSLVRDPTLTARGFSPSFHPGDPLHDDARDTVAESIVTASDKEWLDPDLMQDRVHADLRRFFRRRTRRRPLIVPLLLE